MLNLLKMTFLFVDDVWLFCLCQYSSHCWPQLHSTANKHKFIHKTKQNKSLQFNPVCTDFLKILQAIISLTHTHTHTHTQFLLRCTTLEVVNIVSYLMTLVSLTLPRPSWTWCAWIPLKRCQDSPYWRRNRVSTHSLGTISHLIILGINYDM